MPNQLIHEQSPYLLQHAHNPVDWHPWGDEAFARATAENKPVIVSIGYAACHWCHVMERESFEDEAIAAYMNEHFICVKVDREEHPDVDHLYMDAVQAISGSGGWPLNVFVTPERIPFYGGTYYPPKPAYSRPSWQQLLERMNTVWRDQRSEVTAQSAQMLQYLRQASAVAAKTDMAWDKAACDSMAAALLAMADEEWGGFGNAPKFPGTMAISFLLERWHFYQDEHARRHALRSLDAMIDGGIYDQLGGGFARYSTDREWLAPHFEKMLYDNALLVLTLCEAYQLTREDRYRRIIEETIAFADRELRSSTGAYYSALDADSEGVEGKYYTWTWDEFNEVLDGGDKVAAAYFGVTKKGNWEHTNILHIHHSMQAVAEQFSIEEKEVLERIAHAKEKLIAVQQTRIRPATDDKSLLSWNALMNLALCRAGVALGRRDYLDQAADHLDLLAEIFRGEQGLLHTWKEGRARIPAKLDDYAYLIQAMLQMAAATGNNKWITEAAKWTEYVVQHFSDEGGIFFYFTSDEQQDIPVRKADVHDGATPSANAVMAKNLLLLSMLMEDSNWGARGENMLHTISDAAVRYPYSFGYWSILLQRLLKGNKTAVIGGMESEEALSKFHNHFTPEIFPLLATEAGTTNIPLLKDKSATGATTIYICTLYECFAPQQTVEGALALC
jgi:uncharacterized protein YyaL (SSP411 family)